MVPDTLYLTRDPVVYNNFDYDNLDRVTNVTYLSNQNDAEVFPMDNLGNRTGNVTQRDGVHNYTSASPNITNRYTSVAGHTLAYDDAGNLTIDKDGYHFVYDYENRPVRIYKLNGQTEVTVARFAYDTFGRRIKKEDALDPAKTCYYYYSDNWQVLAEYNGSGTLQACYAYGNYIDEVLLMHRNSADYYYLQDHLYSPAALLDTTGSVVERYEYDAYGTCRILTSGFVPLNSSQYGNTIGFTGREIDNFDFNAGIPRLTKMHYRHRDYSLFMGRFFQEDPYGINPADGEQNQFYVQNQFRDGMNLYEYTLSNSVIERDPFGLWHYAKGISERIKERMTLVAPEAGQSMQTSKWEIAALVRLDYNEFNKWAKIAENKCGYMVPNTAYIHRGAVGGWQYFVDLQLKDIEKFFHNYMGYYVERRNDLEEITEVSDSLGNKDIVAWAFGGHGDTDGDLQLLRFNVYHATDASDAIHHKIAYVILYACYAGRGNWKPLISQQGVLMATKGNVIPWWDDWWSLPIN